MKTEEEIEKLWQEFIKDKDHYTSINYKAGLDDGFRAGVRANPNTYTKEEVQAKDDKIAKLERNLEDMQKLVNRMRNRGSYPK